MRKKGSTNQQLDESLSYDVVDSPFGCIYLIFQSNSLIGVSLKKQHFRKISCPEEIKEQFVSYFRGKLRDFNIKIALVRGTRFEQNVWLSLKKIPCGETRSYQWLAEQVGSPNAVRAVGQALKRNPLPIILPCHRVIEKSGSIGGYSSGVEIKRRLLNMEHYLAK